MKIKTAKAAEATNQSSFLNPFNQLGDERMISTLNSKTKTSLKQRSCPCGNEIPHDTIIFNNAKFCPDCGRAQVVLKSVVLAVVCTPKKASKALFCVSCREHRGALRMFTANTCKSCLKLAQVKPIRERQRFANLILSCTHSSLRGALAI